MKRILKRSLTTAAALLAAAVVLSFIHPMKLSGGSREYYELSFGGVSNVHDYGSCMAANEVVPLWAPLIPLSIAAMWLWNKESVPPGHCQRCGYDLTGNVSGRCPECGSPTSPGTA
jgi:hypothetical protein